MVGMRLITVLLLVMLAGCAPSANQPPVAATVVPVATVPAVGELLSAPTSGEVVAVGYLLVEPAGAVLLDKLDANGAPPNNSETAIWLSEPLEFPGESNAAAQSPLVQAQGQLEGPGQYGPDGRYRYQLAEAQLRLLGVRELSVALLLDNSALYEGQPVRLQGQLLLSADTALLMDRIGSGGVPDASSRQIKLATPLDDPTLEAQLQAGGGGGMVRFGPVEVVGLWRQSRLYPLMIAARR